MKETNINTLLSWFVKSPVMRKKAAAETITITEINALAYQYPRIDILRPPTHLHFM
jgi:hypothetical protein